MTEPDLVRVAAITGRGLVRDSNEDAISIGTQVLTGDMSEVAVQTVSTTGIKLFMVADGMGGHVHGALASRLSLSFLIEHCVLLETIEGCAEVLHDANNYIYDMMLEAPERSGMGTTIVGLALRNDRACYFNVGDSRIYRWDGKTLAQLSIDDALRTNVSSGGRRVSHAVTQAIGGGRHRRRIQPHVGSTDVQRGNRLLLCTDGLTDCVLDEDIAEVLSNERCIVKATEHLYQAALSSGGWDNISIILLELCQEGIDADSFRTPT